MLTIVTGVSGSGKTTWLSSHIDGLYREHTTDARTKMPVGFMTPPRFQDGVKVGIDAKLLAPEGSSAAQVFSFASLSCESDPPFQKGNSAKGEGTTSFEGCKWQFSAEALSRINLHLKGLESSLIPIHDRERYVLVIDEVGPLELCQHKGVTEALNLLDRALFDTILVVRPSLLDDVLSRWSDAYKEVSVIDVTKGT